MHLLHTHYNEKLITICHGFSVLSITEKVHSFIINTNTMLIHTMMLNLKYLKLLRHTITDYSSMKTRNHVVCGDCCCLNG